ncbi:hypothetical protein Tco_0629618 [Tanacetum coccineum]|uniref:Reverse transcriptase domain-containing protein n=1 Tax=Tanacetum coccineum TaxID=301880 RepID=A0ABQ4WTP4_9ASTR
MCLWTLTSLGLYNLELVESFITLCFEARLLEVVLLTKDQEYVSQAAAANFNQVVERETEVTKDTMPPANNGSTEDVQPSVLHVVHHELISEPVNAPTSRALIDVYEGEITLRVGREAITFNLDQTSRYTANYNHMTANRIDVIDMACEEYSQEVLGFSNVISSGNPTPYYDPIVSTSSPTLTPFGDSDFLLFEEADSFLAIEDDPTSPEVDPTYYDPDGDILLLEAILNSDPSPPPNQGNYFPETRKDLKICEANNEKSSVNEPPEVELKDLPPHLEYAFLEGNDKLPVIIAKDLKNEEKAALIEVLKSHKRAIAWKLSDIKGIDPEFCTHKILMEEDYEPTVQHQRRVNLKIHDVIKKEVEKLLDAGLIYPISDSPWISLENRGRSSKVVVIAKLPHPHYCEMGRRLNAEKKEIRNISLETLGSVALRVDSTPWFADFANYHAGNFVVKGISNAQAWWCTAKKLLTFSMLCHNGTHGGHHGAKSHAKRDEMPQNSIQVCEIFDVWGIGLHGTFPLFLEATNTYCGVDSSVKWVEAKALPTNEYAE